MALISLDSADTAFPRTAESRSGSAIVDKSLFVCYWMTKTVLRPAAVKSSEEAVQRKPAFNIGADLEGSLCLDLEHPYRPQCLDYRR